MIERGTNSVGPDFAAELVEGSKEALIALSAEGEVLFWNLGATLVFGYTREEAVGRSIEDLVVPSGEREEARQRFLEVLAQGSSTFETVRHRKDGSRVHVGVSTRVVRGKDGQAEFIAVSEKDVTELTRLREERAIEVRNSSRMQKASRFRSEFLADMSHELRTPLNAIIGFAELMFKGKVGPIADDHREYLGDILDSSRHLLRLLNDVIDLARIESGRMAFRAEPMDLAKVVGEVRDILRGPASVKRIRIDMEIDPTLTTVSLDSAKFKQMLYSYLSNALEVTPEEGHVTVRVAPEAPDRFRIEVEDTLVDAGNADEHAGPGLGIELSRRIVEAQGGHVAARRDLGKGTVFSIVLPMSTTSFATLE